MCAGGGTGRRARLRALWEIIPWRFKSSPAHQNGMEIVALTVLILLALVLSVVLLFFSFYLVSVFVGAPFVPTSEDVTEAMLDIARVKVGDCFLDLGSGDGRLVIAAARRGARAVGYEINPFLVLFSRWRIRRAGFARTARVYWKNLWTVNCSFADVVGLYCLPRTMRHLEQKLYRELRPGSRVVSNAFEFIAWRSEGVVGSVRVYVR